MTDNQKHHYQERSDAGICDFCCVARPAWEYTAARDHLSLNIPGLVKVTEGDLLWGACAACDALIRRGDVRALVTRVVAAAPGFSPFLKTSACAALYSRLLPDLGGRRPFDLKVFLARSAGRPGVAVSGPPEMVKQFKAGRDEIHKKLVEGG